MVLNSTLLANVLFYSSKPKSKNNCLTPSDQGHIITNLHKHRENLCYILMEKQGQSEWLTETIFRPCA